MNYTYRKKMKFTVGFDGKPPLRPDEELVDLIREKMQTTGMTFEDAKKIVMRENPELSDRYLSMWHVSPLSSFFQ